MDRIKPSISIILQCDQIFLLKDMYSYLGTEQNSELCAWISHLFHHCQNDLKVYLDSTSVDATRHGQASMIE